MKQSTIEGLDPSVTDAYQIGMGAWPRLQVAPELFASFLGGRAPTRSRSPELLADLYLACACLHNAPGALETFSRTCGDSIRRAARCYDPSPTFAEEVIQGLYAHLFVSSNGTPRIDQFQGLGRLLGWVLTIARHLALRLARQNSAQRFRGEEAFALELERQDDAEIALFRTKYRELFRDAIVIALRQLDARDGLILRLHVVNGLSMARIAVMYKVSQPTISRWMRDARVQILLSVRETVQDALEIDTTELQSMVDMMASQLELSFSQIFGDALPTSETVQATQNDRQVVEP